MKIDQRENNNHQFTFYVIFFEILSRRLTKIPEINCGWCKFYVPSNATRRGVAVVRPA